MVELRIYYECLEQAQHYIKPMIMSALKSCECTSIFVRLVRMPTKSNRMLESSCFSAICSLVVPDILITGVVNGREYPLVLFEFSEAVITEDHELQKSYGACAACLSNMFYIKVSGGKQSPSRFGGAYYNPYSTPRILSKEIGYQGYIYAEWDLDKSTNTLQKKGEFLSCPPTSPLVCDVINQSVLYFIESHTEWFSCALSALKKIKSFIDYTKCVKSAPCAKDLLLEWEKRQEGRGEQSRFWVQKEYIAAKINRFAHAMDPDRGILIFISLVFSKSRKVYGVYALERPRTVGMKSKVKKVGDMMKRLSFALEKDKMPKWFKANFLDKMQNVKEMKAEVNFQTVFSENCQNVRKSKVFSTLAHFLDGIYLGHNGPLLKWDRRQLLDADASTDMFNALKNGYGFCESYEETSLQEVNDEPNEDEVTYAFVHNVLLPSGFHVVAVSYPGAQGGVPILPNPAGGKAQPREYIDTIAVPLEPSGDVLLNESKGKFDKSGVLADCKKLCAYKEDPAKQQALAKTLMLLNYLEPNGNLREIWIGVSFFSPVENPVSWNPSTIDFMFILLGRKKWKIGMFSDSLANHIKNLQGNICFPVVYEVSK